LQGKGSFGKKIADKIEGWVHLSLGDCMRNEITKQTALGMAIASSMEEGHLVSDSLANKVAIQNLKDLHEKKAVILDGIIDTFIHKYAICIYTLIKYHSSQLFDNLLIIFPSFLGYPRTINQAIAFKEVFPNLDFCAVHIRLERWVAIEKTLGRQVNI
jgi:adenylate kinase family enzyme